jgi:bifunctional ADP-heptose synthase (sugar kinase/adenylyltransferase)
LLPQAERAEVIDALRWIDLTHMCQTETVDVLHELRPRYWVKGVDWRGRLPVEELDACRLHGIELVYVDTVLNSSSEILRRFSEAHVALS